MNENQVKYFLGELTLVEVMKFMGRKFVVESFKINKYELHVLSMMKTKCGLILKCGPTDDVHIHTFSKVKSINENEIVVMAHEPPRPRAGKGETFLKRQPTPELSRLTLKLTHALKIFDDGTSWDKCSTPHESQS
jgi:hypothetical protein